MNHENVYNEVLGSVEERTGARTEANKTTLTLTGFFLSKAKYYTWTTNVTEPQRNLNSSRCVMFWPDLIESNNDEIVKEHCSFGVSSARPLGKSGCILLNLSTQPILKKFDFLQYSTRLYIPNPLRCYIGNTTNNNKSKTRKTKITTNPLDSYPILSDHSSLAQGIHFESQPDSTSQTNNHGHQTIILCFQLDLKINRIINDDDIKVNF